jgi:hypothetical protein
MPKWCDGWVGWTAGIIDGEGSIAVVHRIRRKMQYGWASFDVRITVSNTDIKMMEKLKELWGGSYRTVKRQREQKRTCYHYCICAKQSLNMLKVIIPYLITKRKQAELAYCLQLRISDGLGTYRKWGKMSDDEREIRSQAYNLMKQLNNHKITGGINVREVV